MDVNFSPDRVLKGRVFPIRTAFPGDTEMHKLLRYYTGQAIYKCIICGQSPLIAHRVWVPKGEAVFRDIESGKEIVFGYGMCAKHLTYDQKVMLRAEKKIHDIFVAECRREGILDEVQIGKLDEPTS